GWAAFGGLRFWPPHGGRGQRSRRRQIQVPIARRSRLGTTDDRRQLPGPVAKKLVSTMAEVFEEAHDQLSDDYVAQLLARDQLWMLAATLGEEIVGGLTAHTLPMTRS